MSRLEQLSPRARGVVIGVGVADAVLRLVALRDLRARDAAQVRGSRRLWALALSTVSSAGVLPVCYLLRGRR
ncbi:hypothetical protein [Nocardioides bruguierae]|uniref:hypothetical protein n=1 Tax=Nocardioides bruguierae TaxID=2945102 RepID=UPI002022704F|nr:hypothetical protein [Nocardioides bruguierae]MCL8026860.1 hypothetical protein [Nocardioides bruguierae]